MSQQEPKSIWITQQYPASAYRELISGYLVRFLELFLKLKILTINLF